MGTTSVSQVIDSGSTTCAKGQPEDDQLVQEGISANIRTGRDVENHVHVIASGDTGWLFVNGGYEAELDFQRTTRWWNPVP